MRCAEAADALMRAAFGRRSVAGVKGRGNVVTETDFAVEQAVMRILREQYPGHAILSEETADTTRSDGWMWVIDPVDGTKNFSQSIPHFGFNLALCHGGQPLLGLTTQPMLRDVYVAVAGEGAVLNGQPVHVSACSAVTEAVVAMDMGYEAGRAARQLQLAAHLWPGMQSLRVPGSAALGFAYLAAAKWDLYIHSDLKPWDLAAGLVLVREAGGEVVSRDGRPATIESRAIVAGGAAILDDFAVRSAGSPWEG